MNVVEQVSEMFCGEIPFQGSMALLKLLIRAAVKYTPVQSLSIQSISLFSITDITACACYCFAQHVKPVLGRSKLTTINVAADKPRSE